MSNTMLHFCWRALFYVIMLSLVSLVSTARAGGPADRIKQDLMDARAGGMHTPATDSNEFFVRFVPGTPQGLRAAAHAAVGAQVIQTYDAIVPGLSLVRRPAGMAMREVLASYKHNPAVAYVERDGIVQVLEEIPNDSFWSVQWNLQNTGQFGETPGADIRAPEAWSLTTGDRKVVVVVVDTGIDYTHPDLRANLYRNEADCNTNGIDDDGNGVVDDCYGIATPHACDHLGPDG